MATKKKDTVTVLSSQLKLASLPHKEHWGNGKVSVRFVDGKAEVEPVVARALQEHYPTQVIFPDGIPEEAEKEPQDEKEA